MSCVPAVLCSTDGTEGMISALSTPTPRLLIWKHGEKTRLRYYPRAPTASAWASRVVFIPSSSVSASTLNNHFNMAELVALRVHIPQIEGAQAPLVCTIFPRQVPDWAYRVRSTRAKPTEPSFELYEGPCGARIVLGTARANRGGCTVSSTATRRPLATRLLRWPSDIPIIQIDGEVKVVSEGRLQPNF
jgi:hypothetical protein